MLKRYIQFIKEADETQDVEKTEEVSAEEGDKSDSKFSDLKEEIKKLIENTTKKSGGDFNSFKDKFIKTPEDVKIEGLINDSDIYEFYLKFRNDIDELLNDINFFDEVPSDLNTFGLYDYIINGTERAILEAVKSM